MYRIIFLSIFLLIFTGLPVYQVLSGSDNEHAAKLWDMMQKDDYRDTWKHYPGKGMLYKGAHPHGAFLTTYVNGPALKGLNAHDKELPYGSILIKENYKPDKTLGAITVMERVRGYNPDAGDWYWVKFSPKGDVMTKDVEMDGKKKTVTLAGKPKGCIGCHTASVAGINYIMTPYPK